MMGGEKRHGRFSRAWKESGFYSMWVRSFWRILRKEGHHRIYLLKDDVGCRVEDGLQEGWKQRCARQFGD